MSSWAWRIYQTMPDQVVVGGVHLSRFFRNLTLSFPVLKLLIPVEEFGAPLSVVVAGELPWAESLPHLLFPGAAEQASVGEVSFWRLPLMLRQWAASADMVVVRVDRISARLLFGSEYLHVPELVDLRLAVPDSIDTLYAGNRNRNLKNDLRRVQRNRLTTQISHHEADLVDFYNRFHLPFVRQRFGRFAWPHNLALLRGLFRQGGLIWTLQSGERLAGCAYTRRGRELSLLAIGTVNGDNLVTELGVQVALYHALIEHAQRLGCSFVNLGGSRPLLTDGSLLFKRKWGATLVQREVSNHLLLHWESLERCLVPLLSGTALVFLDRGQLSAVGALAVECPATPEDVSKAVRLLRVPGLHKLYLCSSSGFEPNLDVPEGTLLFDLKGEGNDSLPESLTLRPFAVSRANASPPQSGATAS